MIITTCCGIVREWTNHDDAIAYCERELAESTREGDRNQYSCTLNWLRWEQERLSNRKEGKA